MSAFTVNGDLVHYEKLGRGKPVILVHGWIGSWRYWIPLMRQLQLKYAVYAIDLFGYGDSGKNPAQYAIGQQVDMLEAFMKEMVIPKAAFIGHGLGAMVIAAYAHRQPERVARMMLVSAPLFDPGGLNERTRPGQLKALSAPDVNVLKDVPNKTPEEAVAGSKSANQDGADDHSRATIPRRPAGLDFAIGRAGAPDQTVPSANNETIVNPASVIDREKLREAARAMGEKAMNSNAVSAPIAQSSGTPEDLHNPLKDILAQGSETLLLKTFKRSDPDYEKLQSVISRMDDRVMFASAVNFDSGTMLDSLRQLASPAVLVHGDDDPIIPPPDEEVWTYLTLEKEDTLLPIPLQGVRHFPMLEHEPFTRMVGQFLETPDLSKIEVRERWRRRTR